VRAVVLGDGLLSIPTLPRLEGMERFKANRSTPFHWPHGTCRHGGQRVAVIGTGATGIQVIGEIADKVGELTRVPAPAQLGRTAQQRADLRRRDGRHPPALRRDFANLRPARPAASQHEPDRRGFFEVTRESGWRCGTGLRRAGLRHLAAELQGDLHRREGQRRVLGIHRRAHPPRVKDPKVARSSFRRDHGFGVQRVPLETRYFEAYNRPNVHLVDISETRSSASPKRGWRTSERDYEFDIIVYANRLRRDHRRLRPDRYPGRGRREASDKWRTTISTSWA